MMNAKAYDFSDSYFESGIQIAVKEGNDSIKSYEDLEGKQLVLKLVPRVQTS